MSKKVPKVSGIYMILNLENKKFYIGSTINMWTRRREHFTELARGDHHNDYLQRSWVKYGEDNFRFYIVEEMKFPFDYTQNQKDLVSEHLVCREQYYIDKMKPQYNLRLTTFAHGFHHRKPETTAKIRAKVLGRKNTIEMKSNMARMKNGNKVLDVYKDNILIGTYNSFPEVGKVIGRDRYTVSLYVNGKANNRSGFTIKYRQL